MNAFSPLLGILLLASMISVYSSIAQPAGHPIIIESPEDITYEYRTSLHILSWIVKDGDPSYYDVIVNNAQFDNGFWSSNQEISISIDGFSIGTNDLQITFYDLQDQSVSDSVIITVEDTTAPLITRVPDQEFVYGSKFNFISWSALDSNPNDYVITLDGEFFTEGFWISSRKIAIQVDNLSIGIHEIQITVFDDFQNSVQDHIIIIVENINNIEITDVSERQASSYLNIGLFMLVYIFIVFSLLIGYSINKTER